MLPSLKKNAYDTLQLPWSRLRNMMPSNRKLEDNVLEGRLASDPNAPLEGRLVSDPNAPLEGRLVSDAAMLEVPAKPKPPVVNDLHLEDFDADDFEKEFKKAEDIEAIIKYQKEQKELENLRNAMPIAPSNGSKDPLTQLYNNMTRSRVSSVRRSMPYAPSQSENELQRNVTRSRVNLLRGMMPVAPKTKRKGGAKKRKVRRKSQKKTR